MKEAENKIPPLVFVHVVFFVLLIVGSIVLLFHSLLQILLKHAPILVSIVFLLILPFWIISGIRKINKKDSKKKFTKAFRTALFALYLITSAAICIPLSAYLVEWINSSSVWIIVICIILTLSWYIASVSLFQRQIQEIKIALIGVNAAIVIINETMGIITVGAKTIGLTKTLLFPALVSSLFALVAIEFIVYTEQENKLQNKLDV